MYQPTRHVMIRSLAWQKVFYGVVKMKCKTIAEQRV
jgi:hypothetical protein